MIQVETGKFPSLPLSKPLRRKAARRSPAQQLTNLVAGLQSPTLKHPNGSHRAYIRLWEKSQEEGTVTINWTEVFT